ncbi:MAG TPA: hypothetical protein PLR40_02065 [Microthrixaceae bacterium]|nr:hypothetical protein [Microthrixaceae bacterium]MCB9374852.1 hypothetical protein [Microthrixaceae bacterium]MCB9400905.1 hypothetical protein [Microthrixaceae bacterium]HMU78632.1 hypothetical protein [Microthrixaceae bacterium]HMY86114.1 hypothetical protein [Microthrixaceae bacterium]
MFLTWPRTAIGAGHSLDRPRSSGGTWGHEQYVAAATAPTHPEHAEMVEWRGAYDPENTPRTP